MIIPAAVVIESADSAFGIFAKVISTCPFESRTIFALKCTHLAESTWESPFQSWNIRVWFCAPTIFAADFYKYLLLKPCNQLHGNDHVTAL